MRYLCGKSLVIVMLFSFHFYSTVYAQYVGMCGILNELKGNQDKNSDIELKIQRLRALCDAIRSSQAQSNNENFDSLPDFDLTRIDSDEDMNNLLRRIRRSDSFLHFHRRTSTSTSSTITSRPTSSSTKHIRFFHHFRRDSLPSTSSSSTTSTTTRRPTSSSTQHIRFFHRFRSDSSSSTWSPLPTPSKSVFRIFHRYSTPNNNLELSSSTSTISTRKHRVPEAVRNFFRHSTIPISTSTDSSVFIFKEDSSTFRNLSKKGQNSINAIDRFRNIPQINRVNMNTTTPTFRFKNIKNKTEKKWVQAGKKYLPLAISYAKRYYQKRKHNKMIDNDRYNYPSSDYDNRDNNIYPSQINDASTEIHRKTSSVFYCYQEDFHQTLIDGTLNEQGFGKCNIFNRIVTCPIEIECQTSEADDCCEDEYGTPFCCGHFIPERSDSHVYDHKRKTPTSSNEAVNTINTILIIIAVVSLISALICFIIWFARK